jgi:hypothetical protein
MRLDFAGGIPFPLSGATPKSELPLESKLVQSSRVPPLVDNAASMRDVIKQILLLRGFLRRDFLNSSLAGQVSPKVSVVSSSTLVVKEDEMVGVPSHLGRCVSPPAEKGEDLRVNGLLSSLRSGRLVLILLRRLLCGIRAMRYGMGRMVFSLSLWVFVRPIYIWIVQKIVMRMRFRFWLSWMPALVKRSFIGNQWLPAKRLKVGERC